jgi:predicted nucleic acid-binding protein
VTSIFFDASGLVPLVVVRDQWRPALDRILAGLRRAGQPAFVTTNWTLYEALAQAQRAGKERAIELHRFVSERMTVVTVSREVEQEALRRFLAWQDKSASVVDHANMLAAEATGCEAVLSFDGDFAPLARMAGIRLLG